MNITPNILKEREILKTVEFEQAEKMRLVESESRESIKGAKIKIQLIFKHCQKNFFFLRWLTFFQIFLFICIASVLVGGIYKVCLRLIKLQMFICVHFNRVRYIYNVHLCPSLLS